MKNLVIAWVVVILFAAALVVALLFTPSHSGFEDEAIEMAQRCPLAAEALGTNIHRRMWGYQPGYVRSRSRPRVYRQDVLIEGSRGRAVIDVETVFNTGRWVFRRVQLQGLGPSIELTSCGTSTDIPVAGRRTLSGTITATRGDAPAREGQTCRLTVASTQPYFCRAELSCGGTTLFGATPDTGHTLCEHVRAAGGGAALVLRDEDRRIPRGEPSLGFDERTGVLRLGSKETPERWSFTVRIEGASRSQ